MRIRKRWVAIVCFGIALMGLGGYSSSALAKPVSCYKTTACAGGDCHRLIVCNDGSIYEI